MSAPKRSVEPSNPPSKPSSSARARRSTAKYVLPKPRKPAVFTEALGDKIIKTISELGVSATAAAAEAGVAPRTLAEWIEAGTAGDERFSAFAADLTRARAAAEAKLVRKALGGGKGSSGAAFILERRYHVDYGRRERLEVSGDETAPLVVRAVRQFEEIQKRVASEPDLALSLNDDLARRHAEAQTLALPGKAKS